MPESASPGQSAFDYRGALVFGLALVTFMLVLTRLSESFFDFLTARLFALSAILTGKWIIHEKRIDNPMFDLTVLSDPDFLGASIAWWAAAFGFVSLLIFVPYFLQQAHHLNALLVGLALLPIPNRIRFTVEILKAMIAVKGSGYVGAKFSVGEFAQHDISIDDEPEPSFPALE